MERNELTKLVGDWTGTNRLWLDPKAPAQESDATASVTLEARGQFATIRYTWAYDGDQCEGMLLVRLVDTPTKADVVWIDSWHMRNEFLVMRPDAVEGAIVSALGSYPAPPGPDWGWRITLHSENPDVLLIAMHNITPDGEEAPAVEIALKRAT